jgi:hypothetical protein
MIKGSYMLSDGEEGLKTIISPAKNADPEFRTAFLQFHIDLI